MTTLPLWIAAFVASFVCAVHAIAGGKDTAKPIAAARTLDMTAKHTALLVFHLFTIALVQLTVMFAAAAYLDNRTLAVTATLICFSFAVTGVIYPIMAKVPFKVLPQASMFAGLAFLGSIAASS